jgi:hypothetical protein
MPPITPEAQSTQGEAPKRTAAKRPISAQPYEQQSLRIRHTKLLPEEVFTLRSLPSVGNFPAKQIIPAQILEILEKADKKNGNSVANEAKRTMASVFEFAIATLRATHDSVHPVSCKQDSAQAPSDLR